MNATRWSPAAESRGVDARDALIRLAERSLSLGHRRLAVRRYLMLQACGHEIPPALEQRCAQLQQQIDPRVLRGIRLSVQEWHRMLLPRTAAGLRPAARGMDEPMWPDLYSLWR